MVESNEFIDVYYNYEDKWIKIKLDKIQRLIKYDLEKDFTIIEIIPNDKIKEKYFLLPDIKQNQMTYINEDIYIVQYPEGKNLSFSEGKIQKIDNYDFIYDASTKPGSSGSPILLKNTTKVIGIHKKGNKKNKTNHGTSMYSIIQTLELLKENDVLKNQNTLKKQDNPLSYFEFQNQKIENFKKNETSSGAIPRYIPPQVNGQYIEPQTQNAPLQKLYSYPPPPPPPPHNSPYIPQPIFPHHVGYIPNSSYPNVPYFYPGNIEGIQGFGYQNVGYPIQSGFGPWNQFRPIPRYAGGNWSKVVPHTERYQIHNDGGIQHGEVNGSIHEHPLNYTERANGECSNCHKFLDFEPGLKCDECNLILDIECGKKLNKRKRYHLHPLSLKVFPVFNCDICRNIYSNSCSFHCFLCNFDICGECYSNL